ncbi:hypothetical protein BDN70DRAFT_134810 [Pholiota conissans]|uniref:MYND-type domain-containing protein n=1 Tax=Pholiota conissans TaxID=109636 RepID=A0A9P5YYH2_9AGAR|nr:hypothetical protein BDN70DRAFT_134810 [Pholiota conissans]
MALAHTASSRDLSHFEDASFCARCMHGATMKGIEQGQAAIGKKPYWDKFTEDLAFWKAQMRFLFAVRTEEETRELLERLDRCTCRLREPKIREYHQIGRKYESILLTRTHVDHQTASIAYITHIFLSLVTTLESSHLKAVAKRAVIKRWPTCPEDLIPFGPENLVKAFIVWSRFIPDIMVLRVAAQCVQYCGPLLAPYAVEPALTRCVIDGGRRLFDRTMDTVRLRAESNRRAMGHAFVEQCLDFLRYFYMFYDEQPSVARATMLEGYEFKAVQVCSLLLYAANNPRLLLPNPEAVTVPLAGQAMQFYYCAGLCVDVLPSVLVHPSIYKRSPIANESLSYGALEGLISPSDSQQVSSEQDAGCTSGTAVPEVFLITFVEAARAAIKHIRAVRFDLYCSARDCPKSLHSIGNKFRRCSACNVASYCSKECQENAWNSEQHPHKSICKILKNLVSKAGSDLLFSSPPGAGYRDYLNDLNGTRIDIEEMVSRVTENWQKEGSGVTASDLMIVYSWASYRTYSDPLPMRTECAPGYDDYEDKLKELCARDGATEPQRLFRHRLATAKTRNSMRALFDHSTAENPIAYVSLD